MIVTVTMNPAIDKTVDVENFEAGGLNRIKRVVSDAGGKGINVSKTIHELGGTSIASGFIGGTAGNTIKNVLKEWNTQDDFVIVSGETRTNTKVVDTKIGVTELNEPGPAVTEEEVEQLIEKLEGYASADTLFVLAGSIPPGVDKGIYREITERVHKKGAKVLLDADGELFSESLTAVPDMIKPNRDELERYYKMDYRPGEKELVEMGRKFVEKGISQITISLGQMGALFIGENKIYKASAVPVKVHSTVGAGDAMVAAMAYGWDRKMNMEETAKLAMATSAGAVATIGTKPPSRAYVEELLEQAQLIKVEE